MQPQHVEKKITEGYLSDAGNKKTMLFCRSCDIYCLLFKICNLE